MSTEEEKPPIACPKCESLNTHEGYDAPGEDVMLCNSCGHQWTAATAVYAGPWRVGKSQGRTVYLNDQLCGLMDTRELGHVVASAANVATDLLSDASLAALKEVCARAEDTLKGKSRGHVQDAEAFARYILDLKARIYKSANLEEGE